MPTSRMGLGLSEERKAVVRQANRLKQELYAQQKKIQFSSLLERSNEDVDSYVESQNNVFISSRKRNESESNDATEASFARDASVFDDGARSDDEENRADFEVDVLFKKSFVNSRSSREYSVGSSLDDEFAFDPAAPSGESLREHLLRQLRLDGRFATVEPRVLALCEKIVDALDSSGYFRIDDVRIDRDSVLKQAYSNAVAYPELDDDQQRGVDQFDALFGIESTRDERARAKKALDDYFSSDASSREARRLALEEFDAIVERKSTKEEREQARQALTDAASLSPSLDPLDALFRSKPTSEERQNAERALEIVQSLDPPGVGARDLRESLLLRLRPDAPYATELRKLIADYFDDFFKKRIGVLADKSGIAQATLSQIYAQPFPFYPPPEELFSSERAPTRWIQPEIVVERTEKGRWIARLDDSREDVELDPYYRKMLFSKRVDKKTKEYLRRQLVEAQALIDALRNRDSTLLRVAKAVVDFQTDYFVAPATTPRPLTQQQIADKLGLDSSTVSRACNDKWLATPRGFVAFKSLFPKAVVDGVTSANVADIIRRIVDAEDKNAPLSDEEIANKLRQEFDVAVSRKTVQEHRDRLQILNSRARKREFLKNAR